MDHELRQTLFALYLQFIQMDSIWTVTQYEVRGDIQFS